MDLKSSIAFYNSYKEKYFEKAVRKLGTA